MPAKCRRNGEFPNKGRKRKSSHIKFHAALCWAMYYLFQINAKKLTYMFRIYFLLYHQMIPERRLVLHEWLSCETLQVTKLVHTYNVYKS